MNFVLGLMAATMTLTETWESPTPPGEVLFGPVAWYNEDRMAKVFTVRHIITSTEMYVPWLEEHGYLGAVAVPNAGDRFRPVWINGEGPFYAGDCRQLRHYPGKYVVEVDHRTYKRWYNAGMVPTWAVVSFEPPTVSRFPDTVQ